MTEKKLHKKVFVIGGIVAAIMFAFSFAMVPVYNMICKATGINPSAYDKDLLKQSGDASNKDIDYSREISVQFLATNHMGMPWEFYPNVKSVRVHPGQATKVTFFARNNTSRDMVSQAIPSMTPSESVLHFHKIECFCFKQQPLKAGESRNMPLVFQVDKDLPKDIHVITLSYTLFDITRQTAKKG